jgi:hypothetical protein
VPLRDLQLENVFVALNLEKMELVGVLFKNTEHFNVLKVEYLLSIDLNFLWFGKDDFLLLACS